MASNRAQVHRPRGEGLARRWWILGLALFLVFDLVLVVFALNMNRTPPQAGSDAPTSTVLPSSSPTSTPRPTPTEVPTAAAPQRLIAAVSGDIAWRGEVGTCPDGPSALEYTDDGGASWKGSDPAAATGVNTLVRVVPESATEANVVTLNGDCIPQLVGTFVSGDAWEDYSANLGSYWYINPGDRANVHTPLGDVAGPCESAVAIATRSTTEAAVLCADQTFSTTADGGAGWSPSVTISGAAALTSTPSGYAVAVVAQGECEGTSVVTIIDGEVGDQIGCAGEKPRAGHVAIAAADETIWLWAGESFLRSTDGGQTWN